MALRGVDDSVNGHLYVTESVPAVPCLISLFYIKPQQTTCYLVKDRIVSYLFSTSNHNLRFVLLNLLVLSHISFLHQTTTCRRWTSGVNNCLISLFYIKPQPIAYRVCWSYIVSYLFSTSNHNWSIRLKMSCPIVSYLFSTSNHNCWLGFVHQVGIVSYLFSTSNHNSRCVQS